MKKLLAAVLVSGTALVAAAPPAQAGASTDAALGLGAFAVFNQLVRGETVFHDVFFGRPAPVVVQRPVVVATPPLVVYAPPPPPVIVYASPPPPAVVYVQPAPVVYYQSGWVPPGHRKVKYGHKHHHGHSQHGWR
ncbi:MAG: hypothetical protein ACREKS_20010 [Candidatus Rokuibacteriota bacterium]